MAVHFSVLQDFEQLIKGPRQSGTSTPAAKGNSRALSGQGQQSATTGASQQQPPPPATAISATATAADLSVQQRRLIGKILIKCADISNVARPFPLARKWADILLHEFFRQGDIEKAKGLPLGPFMNRQNVVMAQMQLGFINSIAFPLFDLVAVFAPDLRPSIADVLVTNSQLWAKVLAENPQATTTKAQKDVVASTEAQHRLEHGKTGR
jgi:hypothetical protein